MGEGLTYYFVALFVAWLGWRAGFWVPGILCILAGLGIYALMQDRPRTLGLPTVADWKNDHLAQLAPPETRVLTLQFSILRIPAIWVLAVSSATVYVTRYAIASWGILYLQEDRGYGLADASLFMAVGTLAGIAGCLLYGFTSDKLFAARRPPTNLLFALAELLGLVLIFFGPRNGAVLTLAFVLFGMGLNGLVTSLGGLFAVDIAPKKVAGAAMGFIGVFSYLGAALQENISGSLIEAGMQVVDGTRIYDFGPADHLLDRFERGVDGPRRDALASEASRMSHYDFVTFGNYTKDTIVSRPARATWTAAATATRLMPRASPASRWRRSRAGRRKTRTSRRRSRTRASTSSRSTRRVPR